MCYMIPGRLRQIEKRMKEVQAGRIILEVEVDNQMQRMTVPQFIEAGFALFSMDAKIISGNNLDDARALLNTIPSSGIQ